MFNSSQNLEPQGDNVSCYFSSYIDEHGELLFSCGWGEDVVDLKNFAILLHGMFSGQNKDIILNDIRKQCENSQSSRDFDDFYAFLQKLDSIVAEDKDDDIVVSPLSINL